MQNARTHFGAHVVASLLLTVFSLSSLLLSTSQVAFAGVHDYTVSGGIPDTFPAVGAASVPLSMITVAGNTADDFGVNERINISLNTINYDGETFDDTVGPLSIGGSCGYTDTSSIVYDASPLPFYSHTVSIDLVGPGCDADGHTITISGLRVTSAFYRPAPGAFHLISLSHSTTPGDTNTNSSSTVNLSAAMADNSASVAFSSSTVGATDTSVTLTIPYNDNVNNGYVHMVFPDFVDISGVQTATTGSFYFNGGSACEVYGEQEVRCSGAPAVEDRPTPFTGTFTFSGLKTKYASNADMTSIKSRWGSGSDRDISTATSLVNSLTNVTAADAAASVDLASPTVGGVGNTTVNFSLPAGAPLAASDTVVMTFPSFMDISAAAFASKSGFGGAGTFSGCSVARQVLTCTASGAVTGTGSIVLSGITATTAGTGDMSSFEIRYTGDPTKLIANDASVSLTDVTGGALTLTNVEPASFVQSTSGTATVSFTTTNAIPANGKVKVTFGTGFGVSGITTGNCLASMNGGFSVGVSGQDVTITRDGTGTSQTPAAETCSIGPVTNPSATGSTGVYAISTMTNGNAVIDTDAAVNADTIIAASNGGGAGGGAGGVSSLYSTPLTPPPTTQLRRTQNQTQTQTQNPQTPEVSHPAANQQPATQNQAVNTVSKSLNPASTVAIGRDIQPEVPSPNTTLAYTEFLQGRKDFQQFEKKYQIQVPNGVQDTDKDGLSDVLEFIHKTNPTKPDTDGDGLTDTEEKDFGTSPTNAKDPADPTNPIGNRAPIISNFQHSHYTSDPEPLIKGLGPKNSEVLVRINNSSGGSAYRARVRTDQHGVFLFLPEKPLDDGVYKVRVSTLKALPSAVHSAADKFVPPPYKPGQLQGSLAVAHAADNTTDLGDLKIDKTSDLMMLHIHSELNIPGPNLKKLADADINEDVLKGLSLEIKDNKPVLTGKTGFNHEVIATWSSIVMTSALIADTTAGDFSIQPGKALPIGHHEVYVQSIRPKDKVTSKMMKVSFDITPANAAENVTVTPVQSQPEIQPTATDSSLKSAAEELPTTQKAEGPNVLLMVGAGVVVLIIILGIVFALRRKKTPPQTSEPLSTTENPPVDPPQA